MLKKRKVKCWLLVGVLVFATVVNLVGGVLRKNVFSYTPNEDLCATLVYRSSGEYDPQVTICSKVDAEGRMTSTPTIEYKNSFSKLVSMEASDGTLKLDFIDNNVVDAALLNLSNEYIHYSLGETNMKNFIGSIQSTISSSQYTCYSDLNNVHPTCNSKSLNGEWSYTFSEVAVWNQNPDTVNDKNPALTNGSETITDPERVAAVTGDLSKTEPKEVKAAQVAFCEQNAGALGWILCPVISKLGDALGALYESTVEPFLTIDAALLKDEGGTRKAWSTFQGMANIVSIIVVIIIVLSQLTGIGLNNYGVKKTLPRLIIGIILINLSYLICQTAVDVSNVVGNSVNSFLTNIAVGLKNEKTGEFTNSTELFKQTVKEPLKYGGGGT